MMMFVPHTLNWFLDDIEVQAVRYSPTIIAVAVATQDCAVARRVAEPRSLTASDLRKDHLSAPNSCPVTLCQASVQIFRCVGYSLL